jgi:hypothetical protein
MKDLIDFFHHERRGWQWLAGMATSLFACAIPSHATDLPLGGGSGGDTSYRIECPADSFITGFNGGAGAYVDSMTIECTHLDRITWRLTGAVTPISVSPYSGPVLIGKSTGGDFKSRSCRQESVVHAAIFNFLRSDPMLLDWLTGYCVSVTDPEALNHFDFPNIPPFPEVRPYSSQECPAGEWAAGIFGSYGMFIDSIGLICRPTGKSEQERQEQISNGIQTSFQPGVTSVTALPWAVKR